MGFSVMLWGAEKLVPAEYWCPYGNIIFPIEMKLMLERFVPYLNLMLIWLL